MIYVLHGDDARSSYDRLNQIISSNHDRRRVNISDDKNIPDLVSIVNGDNLFGEKQIFVCEDVLSGKKFKVDDLRKIGKDNIVIFWESGVLPKTLVSMLSKLVTIEIFKKPTALFNFLDNLAPKSRSTFANLNKLLVEDQNLIWHLAVRFFLMICVKDFGEREVAEINKNIFHSYLADWQIQKIKKQSSRFDIKTLKNLFEGVLKIDHLKKSGSTNLQTQTLISVLFLKYL